MHFLRINTYQH